jgi:hypothetical protein
MRRCTITIRNSGTGDVEFVDGRGEWVAGWSPPRTIKPGEAKGFGLIAQTEFRSSEVGGATRAGRCTRPWPMVSGAVHREVFVNFSWDLPYLGKPTIPHHATSHDDPRQPHPKATEFETPDKSPTSLHVAFSGGIVEAGDRVIDLLQAPPLPFVLLGDNVKVNMTFDILDSRAPASTKLPPFSAGAKPRAIPEPVINTNASMWVGRWAGKRMFASIISKEGNRVAVTMTERSGERSIASETQIVGINRIVTRYIHADAVKDEAGADRKDQRPPILVQEGVGTQLERATRLNPEGAEFSEIAGRHNDLLSGVHEDHVQLGGDYLNVDPDAVLEMYRLIADGETVDVALRYRRPARHLAMIGATAADELLAYVPDVR